MYVSSLPLRLSHFSPKSLAEHVQHKATYFCFLVWILISIDCYATSSEIESYSSVCPDTWIEIGKYCYMQRKLHNTDLFSAFNEVCLEDSSSVAIFRNKGEYDDFLKYSYMSGKQFDGTIIGFIHLRGIAEVDDIVSFYDGKSPNWTPSPFSSLSQQFNERCTTLNNEIMNSCECANRKYSFDILCQQLQKYVELPLYVPCTPLCRSLTQDTGHRFSTNSHFCQSDESVVENPVVAYTVSFNVPNMTANIVEVKSDEDVTLMLYSLDGIQVNRSSRFAHALGSFFVFLQRLGPNMESFLVMYKYSANNGVTDTIITKYNSDEYKELLNKHYKGGSVFYMFTSNTSEICYFINASSAKYSLLFVSVIFRHLLVCVTN